MPEKLGHQRTYITKEKIVQWFEELETFLRNEHGIDAKTFFSEANAERVFNLDESGFPLSGTNGRLKIITAKGTKNVYKIAPDTREQVTVLGCASAAGSLMKPLVIYPGVRPRYNFEGVDPDDFDVGCTLNGWISSDCFFGWLANLFLPAVREKGITFPIIIFMDGHTSHINVAVSELCRENDIILYCFPPHDSHLMQPLDVSVYGPLKKYWNESLDNFSRKYRGLAMTRNHFFSVFDTAWKKAVASRDIIRSGFRKSGLLPFNSEAIDFSKLVTNVVAPESPSKTIRSQEEMIGMQRMFMTFKKHLSSSMINLFERRYENGYDLISSLEKDRLWNIYKELRDLVEGKEPSHGATAEVDQNSEVPETDSEIELDDHDEENRAPSHSINSSTGANENQPLLDKDLPSTSEPVAGPSGLNMTRKEISAPSSSEPVAGPSGLNMTRKEISAPSSSAPSSSTDGEEPSAKRKLFIDNWKYSPFKKFLKISDDVVITRKFPKTTIKTPPAISGKSCYKLMQEAQDEKKRKLESKGKKGKNTKQTTKNNEVHELNSDVRIEDEIVFASDEDDSEDNDSEMCFACMGKEDWNVPQAWIGCSNSRCGRWFHKDCLAIDVTDMTGEELDALEFYCKACEKNKK